MERLSEEEYLLGYNKHSSNMYSDDQSDLPWNSNDRDVHHDHTRRRGIQKYLRETCYHRIECTATTFLAAFMWRRPLNNATLTTITYRKPKRVSDGIGTQIRAQMSNKCRIKIVQRELYNVRDLPWGRDRKKRKRPKKEKENTVTIKIILVFSLVGLYLPPRTVNWFKSVLLVLVWSSFKSILAVVQFIKA